MVIHWESELIFIRSMGLALWKKTHGGIRNPHDTPVESLGGIRKRFIRYDTCLALMCRWLSDAVRVIEQCSGGSFPEWGDDQHGKSESYSCTDGYW